MLSIQKLITVVGPTASGKSELAVFLAHEIKKHHWDGYKGAEIISADSRQVYKYLNVGTNKVPGIWKTYRNSGSLASGIWKLNFSYKNISHHCIDFVHPKKTYTVAEYRQCAEQATQKIRERGNIPILVGGTGFYVQAVVDGIVLPEIQPNSKLRKELEKKPVEELFAMLQTLDPKHAASIDRKNPRRLIRAIEIVTETGKPVPSLFQNYPIVEKKNHVLMIGIKRNHEEQKKRVEKMVHHMVQKGLLAETQMLQEKLHLSKKRIRELGFEYKVTLEAISESKTSIKLRMSHFRKIKQKLIKANLQYTKRQMTWFKRDPRIQWIQTKKDALELVHAFLT